MRRLLRILCLPAALMAADPLPAEVLDFEALDGWRDDNHVEALQSFLNTCDLIDAPALVDHLLDDAPAPALGIAPDPQPGDHVGAHRLADRQARGGAPARPGPFDIV